MSCDVDETFDVYHETARRARKEHACSACHETIRVGDRYCSVSWVFDGRAGGVKRCLRCQALHEHLRTLAPGYTWPMERLDCGQRYEDEWGPVPEDIAALAFQTPGEMQRTRSRRAEGG